MNKNLVFRILGALASAMIIVGVFVPFVNVVGYTTNLWETFSATDSLYLPIMIIAFGALGVLLFSLNKKTEFVYMTTGAISFFAVVQTVDILNQGVFDTLSIGYYLIVIGAILTGVMTFLLNMKQKEVRVVESVEVPNKPSVLNQIDTLYSGQGLENTITPIQPVQDMIQPIQPVQDMIQPIQPVQDMVQPIPMPQENTVNEIPVVQNTPEAVQPIPVPVDPIPVMQQETNVVAQNPVVQEFEPANIFMGQNSFTNVEPQVQQPQANVVNPVIPQFNDQNMNVAPSSNTTDIFGQPINK